MSDVQIRYPPIPKNRGRWFWINPLNWWASRRTFLRPDHSNEWRYAFGDNADATRAVSFSALLGRPAQRGFRFVILGDTGEGDKSQWGLVPLLRGLAPDFMIIAGDVAYPAGEDRDFLAGFFAPYRNLGIPIWAVPGNHEYYSARRGREFYDTFCTRKHVARWEQHGLRLVPQPGTYWELSAPEGGPPLVVIGLDSGMNADLDGRRPGHRPDARQHAWLEGRLREAERLGGRVILLWHIPALVRERHQDDTGLEGIHRLIVSSPVVRVVICAHEHNFQQYAPETFARYLRDRLGLPTAPANAPLYVVAGRGGAYLTNTDFPEGPYRAQVRYPTPDQWRQHAALWYRLLQRSPFGKWAIGTIAGLIHESAAVDADDPKYLAAVVVDVSSERCRLTPLFLDELGALFPPGTVVHVADPGTRVDAAGVRRCLQAALAFDLWGDHA